METNFADRRRRLEYEFIWSNSARSLFEPDGQRKVIRCGNWGRFCLTNGIPVDSTRIARQTSKICSQTVSFCSAYVAVLLPDDEGEARVVPLVIVDAVAIKWIVFSLGKLRSLRIVYKTENLSVFPIIICAMKKPTEVFFRKNTDLFRGGLMQTVCRSRLSSLLGHRSFSMPSWRNFVDLVRHAVSRWSSSVNDLRESVIQHKVNFRSWYIRTLSLSGTIRCSLWSLYSTVKWRSRAKETNVVETPRKTRVWVKTALPRLSFRNSQTIGADGEFYAL